MLVMNSNIHRYIFNYFNNLYIPLCLVIASKLRVAEPINRVKRGGAYNKYTQEFKAKVAKSCTHKLVVVKQIVIAADYKIPVYFKKH